jgi:hypothetical protein
MITEEKGCYRKYQDIKNSLDTVFKSQLRIGVKNQEPQVPPGILSF